MKPLSTPEQHQKNIALKTLKMPDAMVRVMGGMDKDEARKFLKSIGYTDVQVRKLEEPGEGPIERCQKAKESGNQAMNRIAVAKELLKVAKELMGPKQMRADDENPDIKRFQNMLSDLEDSIGEVISQAGKLAREARRANVAAPYFAGQLEQYFINWMTKFVEDRNQPGSIVSLRKILEE